MNRTLTTAILFLLFTTSSNGQVFISPAHPLVHTDTALRNEILKWSEGITTPNKLFPAHPSAVNFPGAVKAGSEVGSVTFHFLHKQADVAQSKAAKKFAFAHPKENTLYSTGLYAAPGEAIRVNRPSVPFNQKIYLVIGAHTDFLEIYGPGGDDWRRMPVVSTSFLLDSTFQFASSPFGGLIYIAVSADELSIEADITIEKIIAAPYFKLGATTVSDWKQQLKNNKAPWGEIVSDKVIITLPDSTLQKINNPGELLALWDKILVTEFELSQLPCPFIRPTRMVLDEQTYAGFMHSGYPIMIMNSPSMGLLSEDVIMNPQKLLQPSNGGANWGFFHEIGHNLQNYEWVFDGTIEVGCNFYSLYVFDQLIKTRTGAHINISDSVQNKLMRNFFAKGATYEAYQQDPFLGLIPFMQLQKQFGWEPFKKVFSWYLEYRSYDYQMDDGDDDAQKTNAFKIDRLVERFSMVTSRNLVPFFKAWGIPVSKSVNERVDQFKIWFPKELKPFVKVAEKQL